MERPRIVLTDAQAREIFQLQTDHGYPSLHAASIEFSRRYKVSPKAIRDIWNGRSWLEATSSLWNPADRPPKRTIGRPKGRKDSKPRKCKSQVQSLLSTSQDIIDESLNRTTLSEAVNGYYPDVYETMSTHQQGLRSILFNRGFEGNGSGLPRNPNLSWPRDLGFHEDVANLVGLFLSSQVVDRDLAYWRGINAVQQICLQGMQSANFFWPHHR